VRAPDDQEHGAMPGERDEQRKLGQGPQALEKKHLGEAERAQAGDGKVPKGPGLLWEWVAEHGRIVGHQWAPVSCDDSTGVITEG